MTMDLEKQNIPSKFIQNLPEGLKTVTKKGSSYVVVDDIRCPNQHSLLSDSISILGEPAIFMNIEGGGAKGQIFLDPFWGLHRKLFDFMFADPTELIIIKAVCPVCGVSLMVDRDCPVKACPATQFIEFTLPDGKNKIYACGCWGCPEHDMAVTNIPGEVREAVKQIHYPDIHYNSEAIGF